MDRIILSKGTPLFRPCEIANDVFFLEKGIIEVFTELEGNKFVMDRLGPGTVINSSTFFMEDPMHVYI